MAGASGIDKFRAKLQEQASVIEEQKERMEAMQTAGNQHLAQQAARIAELEQLLNTPDT